MTVSKGPRECEEELDRGTCIFGAMWFPLSQLTSCLAPACLWGPEKLPLLPWFTLSHPLGKSRGGGRRSVRSLWRLLSREVLGNSLPSRHAITWHCHLGDKQQLGVSRKGWGRDVGKVPLWPLAGSTPSSLEAAVEINYRLSRAFRFPR